MSSGEPCGCDEAISLRQANSELRSKIVVLAAGNAALRAERDYLAAFHDASELQQMKKHLREEWTDHEPRSDT